MCFPYVDRGLKVKPTRGIPIRHHNMSSILTPTIIFWKNHWHNIDILSLCLSHYVKVKRNSKNQSRVMTTSLSRAQNGPFATNETFFLKKKIFSCSWLFSLCKIKQKRIQDASFSAPKLTLLPDEITFLKKLLIINLNILIID